MPPQSLPEKISTPPPRGKRRYGIDRRRSGKWMDVGIVLVLVVSIIRVPIKALVLYGGDPVSGHVETIRRNSGRGSSGATMTYSYQVDGRRVTGRQHLADEHFYKVSPGQSVEVRVHPFPGRWFDEAIVPGDSRRSRLMDAALFALMISVLAVLFLWGLHLARKG